MIGFYLFSITKSWFWKFTLVADWWTLIRPQLHANRTNSDYLRSWYGLFTTIRSSKALAQHRRIFTDSCSSSQVTSVFVWSFVFTGRTRFIWNAGVVLFKQTHGSGRTSDLLHSFARPALATTNTRTVYILIPLWNYRNAPLAISPFKPVRMRNESRSKRNVPSLDSTFLFIVVLFVHVAWRSHPFGYKVHSYSY